MNTLPTPATPASTELKDRGYIGNPETLEEFAHNARFQLENVEGFLMMDAEGYPASLGAAIGKTDCLVNAAIALQRALAVERLKRETQAAQIVAAQKGGAQ
jgi:hypothetical protein